jgi:hypothetical protein
VMTGTPVPSANSTILLTTPVCRWSCPEYSRFPQNQIFNSCSSPRPAVCESTAGDAGHGLQR